MDTTFVYGIDKKKFFEILKSAKVENSRFDIKQATKYESLDNASCQFCMLFDKEKRCLAMAIVDTGFSGPGDKKCPFLLDLQGLVKGGGFGKRALLLAIKKFGSLLLMADPSQSKDLVKYYQSPDFGFDDHAVDAEKSVYDAETHFFSRGIQATPEEWDMWLSDYEKKDSEEAQK